MLILSLKFKIITNMSTENCSPEITDTLLFIAINSIGMCVTAKGQNENDLIKKFKTNVKNEIATQLSQP